jgi:hypothetical protein
VRHYHQHLNPLAILASFPTRQYQRLLARKAAKTGTIEAALRSFSPPQWADCANAPQMLRMSGIYVSDNNTQEMRAHFFRASRRSFLAILLVSPAATAGPPLSIDDGDTDCNDSLLDLRAGFYFTITEKLHLLFSAASGLQEADKSEQLDYDIYLGIQYFP